MGLRMWIRDRFGSSPAGLPANRDPGDDRWYGVTGEVSAFTAAGVPMTYEVALQIPAVLACLTVLSQDVAKLPLGMFRRRGDTAKDRLTDHPLHETLTLRPNGTQTAFEFRQQMTWDVAFWRNAYARIDDGERGPGTVLTRLEPRRVTPRKIAGGLRYEYREDDGQTTILRADRVMHLRTGPVTYDGTRALSVLETSSHVLGQAFAVQDFASAFFANYTASGERIIPPANFKWKDEESRLNWLRQYTFARTGRNRHKPALLPGAFDVKSDQVNNEQAQFIETKREAAYDVARIWRMPPHKIQLLDRATNNNIEHQGLEYVTDCLLPYLIMWEQAYTRDLIAEEGAVFAEHNVAGLLRGDAQSRFSAYAVGRQWGWLSVNEIRARENMNPIEGGDQYLVPANMIDATTADPIGDLERDRAAREPADDTQREPRESEAKRMNGDARH